jgi:hypothetical protein
MLSDIPEPVQINTELMLKRRGYTIIKKLEEPTKVKSEKTPHFIAENNTSHKIIIFFLKKNIKEKITTKIITSAVHAADNIYHIILIHNVVFTPDATKHIENSKTNQFSSYVFEVFTFQELMYDLFNVLFQNAELDDNIIKIPHKFAHYTKLGTLLTTDPIARYLFLKDSDIVCGRFDFTNEISFRKCKKE